MNKSGDMHWVPGLISGRNIAFFSKKVKDLRLTGVALVLTLSGCIATPQVTRFDHPLAEPQLGLSSNVAPKPADSWWQAYGDPQLDDLMHKSLAGNPNLAQALARMREAQASVYIAHASQLPTVNLDTIGVRERFSRNDLIPQPLAGGVHSEGRAILDFSWDLDFWGRQSALFEQAHSKATAAALDVESARLALTGAVLKAYVELDRQYALADLATRSEQQREKILDLTRRRVGAGLDTNIELREAEGAVPLAHVELKQALADRARAIHLLAALSGQGADAYGQINRPKWNIDAKLLLPESLPADLLGRRPDVLAARARIEAATAGQTAAKAAFYPDINLTAFAGFTAIGASNLFQSASASYGVGPALHLPIFDAGRLKAEYRGATAEIDESVAAYNGAVLGAVREVADQLSTIEALGDQVTQQQETLEAAEAAYRLAGERYQAGLSPYLTVLNTETQVLAARRQQVELVAAQANARVALTLAAGGDFD